MLAVSIRLRIRIVIGQYLHGSLGDRNAGGDNRAPVELGPCRDWFVTRSGLGRRTPAQTDVDDRLAGRVIAERDDEIQYTRLTGAFTVGCVVWGTARTAAGTLVWELPVWIIAELLRFAPD